MQPPFRDNTRPLLYAVLVHVGLAIVAVVSLSLPSRPPPAAPAEVIQAVVVDDSKPRAEAEKQAAAEALQREEEQHRVEDERKEQAAQQERVREEQRLAEVRQQQVEEQQTLKLAEQKRQEEIKLQADAQKKRAAEDAAQKKKQAEADAKRAAEEAARKKQQAELEKKQAAEAAERKKKQAELDKQRKAEAEKRRQEAENALQEQLASEQQSLDAERNRRLSTLRGQYERAIAQKVERNWPRPATALPGWSCKVRVTQIPGGEVVGVEAVSCSGDAVFKRSVESAVYRASPLPAPPDPALFDREILFTFKPEG